MSTAETIKKKEEKRKSIIEAALRVFSRKGYSPAALDEVAKEASIAKGTLYLYFEDKEDLFYSTIMYVIDNLSNLLQENIRDDMDPIETLKMHAYYLLRYFSQNDDYFGIFETIFNDNLLINFSKLFKSISERRKEMVDFLRRVVDRGKEDGHIRRDIPTDEIVYSYEGIINNALHQLAYGQCIDEKVKFNPEEKVKSIMKIFLEGVSSKKTGL